MEGGLLTIQEAAKVLGVSVTTMRELVWAGRISYIDLNKGGKHIRARFTRQHLEEFMAKNEVKAG